MRSNHLLWAMLAMSVSLHTGLAAPAPFQTPTAAGMLMAHYAREVIPLMTQAPFWPSNNAPALSDTERDHPVYELPDVSEVFKNMVADSSTPLPAALASSSLSTYIPATTTPMTTGGVRESTAVSIWGPGLVIVPTPVADPESNPTSPPGKKPHRSYPAPVHKLVVIGALFGGIVAFTFCLFILVDRRALGFCWRTKKPQRQIPTKNGLATDPEKEIPSPPWAKFSPSYSNRGSSTNGKRSGIGALPHTSRVIDITPGFPRSKFSVTSSDYSYPPSALSSASSVLTLTRTPVGGEPVLPSPLLPPGEFFSLPSASDLQDIRHSRTHSAPVFGHAVSTPLPSVINLRSGDHRRSKSVSGLVYDVKTRTDSWDSNPLNEQEWPRSVQAT